MLVRRANVTHLAGASELERVVFLARTGCAVPGTATRISRTHAVGEGMLPRYWGERSPIARIAAVCRGRRDSRPRKTRRPRRMVTVRGLLFEVGGRQGG